MTRKLYGSARAVSDIDSLQIGTSSSPAISAVNKATFISTINSTKAVRDMIIAGDNITGAAFEIVEDSNNDWRGSIVINFGDVVVKSGPSSVTLNEAIAYVESCGGTVITPVTRSLYSPLTLTDITYGNGTRQIKKLYGPVEETVTTVNGTVRSGGSVPINSFDGDTFLSEASSELDPSKTLAYVRLLEVLRSKGDVMVCYVGYTDNTEVALSKEITDWKYPDSPIELYGISCNWTTYGNTTYIDITTSTTVTTVAKEIKKLYGSVNGQTKLLLDNS